MKSRGFHFWLISAATVLAMAVTASLGFWQLDRAAQKQGLQDQIRDRSQLPPWRAADLLAAPDPKTGLHRPVQLDGEWVTHADVFLDNRQMNGRPGFFLVTPLRLEKSTQAVLVQRGWVARDFLDRSRVPAVATPAGPVRIEGRLAMPPGQLFQLGEPEGGPIRQNLDLEAFAQEIQVPLLGVSAVQTGDLSDGLLRQWPNAASEVPKHHGYAFQWFGLCALVGFLYVWFQLISPRRKRSAHVPETR